MVSRGPMRVALEQGGRTRVIDRYVVSAPVAGYARRIALDAGDAVSPGVPLVALEPARAEVLDACRSRAEAARPARRGGHLGSRAAGQRLVGGQGRRSSWPARRSGGPRLLRAGRMSVAAVDEAAPRPTRPPPRCARPSSAWPPPATNSRRRAPRWALRGGRRARRASAGPLAGGGPGAAHPRKSEGPVAAGQNGIVEVGDPRGLEGGGGRAVGRRGAPRPGAGALRALGGEGPLEGVVRVVEPSGFTKVSALGVEEQRVGDRRLHLAAGPLAAPRRRLPGGGALRAVGGARRAAGAGGSLFRDGGEWAAFVVEDGRAVKRRVKVGQQSGVAELLEGAREGEQAIAHPDDRLREGVRVETR